MLFYPQLLTGTVCQYPIGRRNTRRTLTNVLQDGTTIRVADTGAASVSWDLSYSHLKGTEADGLRGLFEASFGEWGSFTFLDPTDNLLQWSEDLTRPAWRSDPLLSLSAEEADPFGGTSASRINNGAQTGQQLAQDLAIPGWYRYCLSVYLRSEQSTQVSLFGLSGSESAQSDVTVTSEWRRIVHSFQLTSQSSAVSSGIRLSAGASVSAFGFQLEAQLGAGAYMKTRDRAGVYPKVRFQGGTFRPIATGVDQFACSLTIVANVAG